MFDHALSQYAPSKIERFGVCLHGLVHFYTNKPIENINTARRRDIKIVTNGGKVFYPLASDLTNYTFFFNESAPIGKTVLYQHPLAVMELEDEITGMDWSGYALINALTATTFPGLKVPLYSGYPVTPDDDAVSFYSNGSAARRILREWPNGSYDQGAVVTKTGQLKIGSFTTASPDGRKQIIVYPSFWDDPLSTTNRLTLTSFSGIWPDITAHTEYIENVNEQDITYTSDSNRKTITLDCRPPDISTCYEVAADLSFKTKTENTPDEISPDNSVREEINKTLLTASISNDGVISPLKLIHRDYSTGAKTRSLTGSISAEEFDDANDFCKTALQPTGWHRYKGTLMVYTAISEGIGTSDYSIAIDGWGGRSEYRSVLYSKSTSTQVVRDGSGTMAEYSDVTTIDTVSTLTIDFEGAAIDHGIAKPQITGAWFTSIAGNPFGSFDINRTYDYMWVHEEGSNYNDDGSNVALIRVYLHQYSADMFSLACGIAKGTITDEEFGKKFNVTSTEIKIGAVFSHGSYKAGSFSSTEIVQKTFGASNPKTGEIVRDMPYPVIYI